MTSSQQYDSSRMIKDQEIDDLLSKLSVEELEELQIELVDPDDPHIPAGDRCRYRTDKTATGPFDRQKLLDHLHNKAANELDWTQNRPYVKETKGKVWKGKEVEKVVVKEDAMDTAFDEALSQATDEELVDLAAILGFHGMLNQSQYHHAFVAGGQASHLPGGLQAVTKCEPCKQFDYEPPNNTNTHHTTQQVKDNDPALTSLNFNNIKEIPAQIFKDLFTHLSTNTHLTSLHLANTALTDAPAKMLAEALTHNTTLEHLNVESNFLSGSMICQLLNSINQQQSLVVFKVANQRPDVLGVKNEMEIAKLLRTNTSLMRFGVCLEVAGAKLCVDQALQKNNDAARKERTTK